MPAILLGISFLLGLCAGALIMGLLQAKRESHLNEYKKTLEQQYKIEEKSEFDFPDSTGPAERKII